MTGRARTGFTLVEVMVVIAIVGVAVGVTVPALRDLAATDPLAQGASATTQLLARARQTAVERAATVRVSLHPASRRYTVRALTAGTAADSVASDSLALPDGMTIDETAARLAVTFAPTGEARGDTLVLRWQGRIATIVLDPWTGDAHVATH